MAAVRTIICLIVALLGFAPAKTSAAERVYFIAADEVAWDYAPSYPNNPIIGERMSRFISARRRNESAGNT
jgi:hypothetical protein